ncbi:hypothetical protein ACHAP5_005842 [Fusarium lateritium]
MELFNSPNFHSHIEDLMTRNRVPGLSIAIVQGDQIRSAGFGLSSVRHQTPCTADTLFDIASSSKSLTGAAIELLVADDEFPEIQYDALMSELLPDDFVLFEESYTKVVTIDDLLGHRTGMPGHDDSYMGLRAAEPDSARSITRNLRNLAQAAPPGMRYIYCNMMYTVLTHLIEVRTKKSFGEYLQQRIFTPLGMASSSLQPENAKARGHGNRLAKGHIWDKKTSSYREIEAMDCPEGQGAGSVVTSVNDFIKWIKALLNREGPINEDVYQGLVRPRSPRPVKNRQRKANIDRLCYAAGMDSYWHGDYAAFGHSGDITGFGSRFVFLPDLKFGAVAMGNSSGTNSVAAQLFRELIENVTSPRHDQPSPAHSNFNNQARKQHEASIQANAEQRDKDKGTADKARKGSKGTLQGKGKMSKRNESPTETIKQQDMPLVSYTGNYLNPGYRNMNVEFKTDRLFIDATDRSLGFTAYLEHQGGGSRFDAHVRDAFDTGAEILRTEFVIDNGTVVRMGMDLEPLVNDLIWFDKVT